MRPILPTLFLGSALVLAGCQHPDGSTDWGSTVALGAGAALVTGLAVAAADDNNRARRAERRYYERRHYGHGYGHDRGYYGRPYHHHPRRW
ncbi:hypothetical protein [Pseudoroseomonas cervicalis]|uniref:hypothetical protein n=1 Tax=Teichococcus cervicalis TaxID=204525 RepID=UPI00278B2B4F|nr:hypothetical protein [Pseudoroseomonas cervicalis]MDQ1078845.1 hypothetical protein [Pseudoroseomonas cervicalis]